MSLEPLKVDTVIIGSGFAGLAAYKKAIRLGQKALIVAKDYGATRYFSGGFDLIDPRHLKAELLCQDFSLVQTFKNFCEAFPRHFYAESLEKKSLQPENVIQTMRDFFDFYELKTEGDLNTGLWAVSSVGLLKPVASALPRMAWPAIKFDQAKKMAVLGFEGLLDYNQKIVAFALQKIVPEVSAICVSDFSVMPAAPYVSILRALKNPENAQIWSQHIEEALKTHDFVVVPPVLEAQTADALYKPFDGRLIEMLSVLPSVAFERFESMLKKVFLKKSIQPLWGEVTSFERTPDRTLKSLSVQTKQGEVKVSASQFIMATGKFLGGGIVHKNQEFKEPLLDLPLFIDNESLAPHTHITNLIQYSAKASQAFLKIGVAPFAPHHYKNLSVCGHLCTGFDFTRDQCGFGVSVLSGDNAIGG